LQGHALFARQAGGANPCPATDFTGGFNQLFARAYGLSGTVEETYGTAFNPFLNDQNFFLSVVTLEELGATGKLDVPFPQYFVYVPMFLVYMTFVTV